MSRSTPGRTTRHFVPTHRDWHHDRNGERGSLDLLERVLYRNPRRGLYVREAAVHSH